MDGSRLSPARRYPKTLVYQRCRSAIRNGDLLLWRPVNFLGRLIAFGTHGKYSHVGMAGWEGEPHEQSAVLKIHEFLQWHGGLSTNLSLQIRHWPGYCDLYRVPGLHGRLAARAISRRTGQPYGWANFFRLAWRTLFPSISNAPGSIDCLHDPLICSAAVADAVRRGGVNIASAKWNWEVTPADLAAEAKYLGTLIWEDA